LHDVVILGGGPGGYGAALYAHNFGLSVALVEKDERVGGTCLLRGCIPAKTWLQAAEVMNTVKSAADFGVTVAGEAGFDWEAGLKRKNAIVDRLVRGLAGLLKQRKVEVIRGTGRLDGAGKVVVSGENGEQVLEGTNLIVATGSVPRSIPGWEIDGDRIVSSDHALDWASRPDRVVIVGAGVIGCEFASLLADLGSEVHVFELMDQIIPGADPDAAKELQRLLSRRGIKFSLGVSVEAPKIGESSVMVTASGSSVEADVALMAVGRGAVTEGIGLDTVGITPDRGFITVDPQTMLAAPGVYAVGDVVAGTPQLAHAGFAEAIAAVTHLATGEEKPVDYRAIPRVTYTHPEMAEVGLTEPQAAEAGIEVETHSHSFVGIGRAQIIGQNQGMVKVIAERDGPIVGASVVGPHAGELIHELMYMVGWEALPTEAAAFIHAHPSLSEAVGESLLAASGRGLH
jgi:dihydrolipoamide dehydrogenase